MLEHMSDDVRNDFLQLLKHMSFSGEVPAARRKTLFKVFSKNIETSNDKRLQTNCESQVNESGDACGIVVEIVQFVSRTFLQDLLHLYNVVMNTGNVPSTWNKTMFIMLAKFSNAKLPSDSPPIASVRILYKVFTCMMLARVEQVLEASQAEEQHGFRCGCRLEEHLVSAKLVIDKLLAVGKPVWTVSLDLSKAFDRVNWSKLWAALAAHGVSQHLVWIIQCLCWKQDEARRVSGKRWRETRVRPEPERKLFSSVHHWAMRKKRRLDVEHAQCGIDLVLTCQMICRKS